MDDIWKITTDSTTLPYIQYRQWGESATIIYARPCIISLIISIKNIEFCINVCLSQKYHFLDHEIQFY